MNIPGYKIIELIKNSDAGELYLASQMSSGRPVVIKYLPKSSLDHSALSDGLKRFLKEGDKAKYLSHPNIAKLHDVGHNDEAIYSVVDYVPGETVQKRAADMCLLDKIYVIKQLAGALDYLAERKMGHFNLKPSNIIISSETSRSLLTDFGFAQDLLLGSDLVLAERKLSSIDYLSPEQIQRETAVDARSDLYSLGAVFCFLLTGKAPFKRGAEAVGAKQGGVSFVELPNELSIFQEFVDYSLALMPDERFQSGREMIEELDRIDDEDVIAIEGYKPDSNVPPEQPLKKAASAGSNVVSLSTVMKKKKLNFHELLAPKEEPKPSDSEENDKPTAWDDIPPTEFTNNYEYLEGIDTSVGKSRKKPGKKRPVAPEEKQIKEAAAKIAKPQEAAKGAAKASTEGKGASKNRTAVQSKVRQTSSAKAGVAMRVAKGTEKVKPSLALASSGAAQSSHKEEKGRGEKVQEVGAVATKIQVGDEGLHRAYQTPIEGPWPKQELKSAAVVKHRRRTLLLVILLAASLLLFSSNQ